MISGRCFQNLQPHHSRETPRPCLRHQRQMEMPPDTQSACPGMQAMWQLSGCWECQVRKGPKGPEISASQGCLLPMVNGGEAEAGKQVQDTSLL